MFTGLIAGVGTIVAVEPLGRGRDSRLVIEAPPGFLDGTIFGASIACAGCCLTAVHLDTRIFAVEASTETLSLTTLGAWTPGTRINLERSLRLGDELGGHLVSGHVDGVGQLERAAPEAGSLRLGFSMPPALARFIACKGSVAVDGVSLTVNSVSDAGFDVNIIPHTSIVTTLGSLRAGDPVNIEIDMLARYVARLASCEAALRHDTGPVVPNTP